MPTSPEVVDSTAISPVATGWPPASTTKPSAWAPSTTVSIESMFASSSSIEGLSNWTVANPIVPSAEIDPASAAGGTTATTSGISPNRAITTLT